MDENYARWDKTIGTLEALYKDVERRSFSLPTFSLSPFVIGMWNSIKAYVCSVLDIFLFVPMNVIIFVRNLFPGRWRYRSFSGSYWKYAITWLWRGEAFVFPFGVIRPLVTFMGIVHVYSRFRTIERCIYLDDTLAEQDRTDLNKKIAAVLDHWKRPTMVQVVYSYVLPVVGLLITVYKSFFSSELPQWVSFIGLSLLGYALTFVISAFMFKRSLMLGAAGRAVYFPGAIAGNQGYSKEREILDTVGIKTREWPFDIVLAFISFAIGFASFGMQIAFYKSVGIPVASSSANYATLAIQSVVIVMMTVLILYRRRTTGRS
jgi:hypothetical protein